MGAFVKRLAEIHSRIAAAAARAGRSPDAITLVAVSKTHPAEAVAEAVEAGQTLFGENRVQEAKAKIPLSPVAARWHLIGGLQKNKIRQALPLFELIHSVDSLGLAREIDRIAAELGLFPRVLLEVNVAGEASKIGFSPEALREAMPELLALPRVQVEGLMTVPPYADEPEDSRPYFQALRALRDDLEKEDNARLPELSMGMSGDFEVAVEEGATFVRIGSSLFGPRRPRVVVAV